MPKLQERQFSRNGAPVTRLVKDGVETYNQLNPALVRNFTNLAFAHSVRRVVLQYSGPAIRVRRSSDNAEMDIGFNGIDLDETALLAFVGAGDGFVAIIYDQSGNIRNLIQPTISKQAKIVNVGVINKVNGIPSIDFDGADDNYIRTIIVDEFTSDSAYFFMVFKTNDDSSQGVLFQYNRIGELECVLTENRIASKNMEWFVSPLRLTFPYTYDVHNQITCGTVNNQTDGIKLFLDGKLKAIDTGAWPGGTNNTMTIGANRNSNTVFSTLQFQELIAFNDDKSAERIGIEENQKLYYGTA